MRQSIIKVGVDNFLHTLKFNKEYHTIYNNIFYNKIELTYEIFIYFILQAAYQNKFYGYFDELYEDVIKRKSDYIRELINNFKIAFLGEPTSYDKLVKIFYKRKKPTEKEIFFHRSISIFEFDKIIDQFFESKNKEKKQQFINFCELIHKQKKDINLDLNIKNKVKKRVSFSLSTRK